MNVKIAKAELLKGVRLAAGVADRKSAMPILGSILIRVSGTSMLLAATDLTVSLTAELQCEVLGQGSIAVDAKKFYELVQNLPGKDLSLKLLANSQVELKSGKTVFKIPGSPDREFPMIPSHAAVEFSRIDTDPLRELVDKVMPSVCDEEARHNLNGGFFESDGKLGRMVSMDGHRFTKVERPMPGGPTLPKGIIVPTKGLTEIKRLLDQGAVCKIGVLAPHLYVVYDGIALAIKLIEAEYPPYNVFIDHHKMVRKIVVNRVEFSDAVRRVQLMSPDTGQARFEIRDDILAMSASTQKNGDAQEEIPCKLEGPPWTYGGNVKYFAETASTLVGEELVIEFGDAIDKPAFMRAVGDDGVLIIIMLMRV